MQILLVRIRLIVVQESPMCDLKEHLGSDKSYFFIANDYSDEAAVIEKFVFKFGNAESNYCFIIFSFEKFLKSVDWCKGI